jgi:hypothetical protein
MFIAKSISKPPSSVRSGMQIGGLFMPLLTELGLIYWAKSTNRSRLTPKAFGAVLGGFSTVHDIGCVIFNGM